MLDEHCLQLAGNRAQFGDRFLDRERVISVAVHRDQVAVLAELLACFP